MVGPLSTEKRPERKVEIIMWWFRKEKKRVGRKWFRKEPEKLRRGRNRQQPGRLISTTRELKKREQGILWTHSQTAPPLFPRPLVPRPLWKPRLLPQRSKMPTITNQWQLHPQPGQLSKRLPPPLLPHLSLKLLLLRLKKLQQSSLLLQKSWPLLLPRRKQLLQSWRKKRNQFHLLHNLKPSPSQKSWRRQQ